MCQRVPYTLVADVASSEGLEDIAVHGPLYGLGLPVAGRQVPLEAPEMKVLVGDSGGAAQALCFLADSARGFIAMGSAVSSEHAVDRLHDVELAAAGPAHPVSDGVAQHPEGRPQPLLGADSVGTEADPGLDASHGAVGRREGVLALDSARGPAVCAAALPWHDLEGVTTGNLNVPCT